MKNKVENWIDEINSISAIVQRILADKETFENYFQIVKNNPNINIRNHHFHLWVTRCYFTHVLINIRALTDQKPDTLSLLNLLTEIQENNNLVDINWYKNTFNYDFYDSDFKKISNGADIINKSIIKRDKSLLIKLSKNIKEYTNSYLAHKSKKPTSTEVPKYKDICLFYERFEEVFKKYYLLLTAKGINSLTPIVQYNWFDIFNYKWIDNNSTKN